MRRAILTVLCCKAGENGEERETGERMAAGRVRVGYARGTRNGKAVNISVKRESRQFCAFQS